MENLGIVCGIFLGLFGSIFSVIQFLYQKTLNERLAREQEAKEREQEKKNEIRDRLSLLMQVIIDKDIPRESRQPFYDEYLKLGGNGTIIKFWAKELKQY